MSRYKNTTIVRKSLLPKKENTVLAYDTTLYARIPESDSDLHLISTEGDRCDNLAKRFYGDANFWWFIAKANNLNSMNIPKGIQLRIPASTSLGVTS
tara:strand:+ start:417 stop:707 length:291 start_codon:yes stop_codon:yes gene_type:complete